MNDNTQFSDRVLALARRRHMMECAGAGPLLVVMECGRPARPAVTPDELADRLMLEHWPALIDGE